MATISNIKIKQEKTRYAIQDNNAIRAIKFNGSFYFPTDGVAEFDDGLDERLALSGTLLKKIYNYGDEVFPSDGALYIVKEETNDFSGYSMFTYDGSTRIRLSTPTPKSETEDINFGELLFREYPKFLNWNSFISEDIYKKRIFINGIDLDGDIVDDYLYVYVCKNDYDAPNSYKVRPYIVYKKIRDNITYYIKNYVDINNVDGSYTLIQGDGTKASEEDSPIDRNNFARTIDKEIIG